MRKTKEEAANAIWVACGMNEARPREVTLTFATEDEAHAYYSMLIRSARKCECGHEKSVHEQYEDHDECRGCRGLDDPCCDFADKVEWL